MSTKKTTTKKKKGISVAARKAKGRRLQQWTCQQISNLLGIPWGYEEAIRPALMGESGVDVKLVGEAKKRFPFAVECKNCEQWGVAKFIEQAKENQGEDTDWLVVMKKNNHEEVVVLDAKLFFKILKQLKI